MWRNGHEREVDTWVWWVFSTLFLAPAITKVEKKCDLEEHFLACRVSWTCFPIDQPDDDGGDGPSGSYGDN